MSTNNKPAGAEEFKFPDEAAGNQALEATVGNETTDDFEVEIVDDTPERDRGRRPLEGAVDEPTQEELEGYSDKVKKRIDSLTHARHDERRQREATERRAKELETFAQRLIEENKTLKKTHNATQEVAVTNAKAQADAALELARKELKAAHEAFDTDAIVAAQEKLAEAKMRTEGLKNFKPTPLQESDYELQHRQAQQPQVPQPDQQTLSWQARNQWFGQNEEATSFALGVHQRLVNSGVDPRSQQYYEQIDARMKSKFPELFSGESDDAKSGEVPRKPATVVAPASRSTGPRKIVLTKTQQELAKRLGLTNQQYAAQVAKLENQNG